MRSHSIQQKVGASVRLPWESSDEDQIWQNSTACVDGHRAAVQEKDTAHVKHLHMEQRETRSSSIAQWRSSLIATATRDRASHSGVEDLS